MAMVLWVKYHLYDQTKNAFDLSKGIDILPYDSILSFNYDDNRGRETYTKFYLLTTTAPLFVPANVPIDVQLTSADVLHSWAYPL